MSCFMKAPKTFFRSPKLSSLLLYASSKSNPLSSSTSRAANSIESRLSWTQFGWSWKNHHGFCSHSRPNSRDNANSIDLTQYPPERIRNFSIIAHVDHGKSTLADRLLELTGTIKRGHGQPQYLDKLQVERERGITVKAQTATMFHMHKFRGADVIDSQESGNFLLNLIDTPGHVDFSYEVSRSLAACQGALLVVDAAQGVQAQTVANFYLAFESNLTIIPVINKIDQPTADPDRVKAQLKSMFDLDPSDCLLTSAKTGQGLEQVLPTVIERIPPPPGNCNSSLRMLLLDSYYDEYKGVICHVAVVDGTLRKGDKISSAGTGQAYEVSDVGFMHPELTPTGVLLTGQVGYIVSGMRSTKEARVGDTLYHSRSIVEPLPGFKPAKHMVFSGLYPADGSDFDALNHAIERLTCNDASVSVTKESSTALGLGFRCGFLGLLHMDVFHQRLEQDRMSKQQIGTGRRVGDLYVVESLHLPMTTSLTAFSYFQLDFLSSPFYLWHSRLGHLSADCLRSLAQSGILGKVSPSQLTECRGYKLAKMTALPFRKSTSISAIPFSLVHTDVWGRFPVLTKGGSAYYVSFVDDCTRYTWVYLMTHKFDFYQIYRTFQSMITTQFGSTIKVLRFDLGGKYFKNEFCEYLANLGTIHQTSCTDTPAQNGRAEHQHRHLPETVRSLLLFDSVPAPFWEEAVLTAVFLLNRMPTPLLSSRSPYEALFFQIPNYSLLRVFVSACFVLLSLKDRIKL